MEIRVGRDMLIVDDEEESAESLPPRELRIARALSDAFRRRSRLVGTLVVGAIVVTAAFIPRDGTHATVGTAAASAAPSQAAAILQRITAPIAPAATGDAPAPPTAASDYDLIYAVTAGPYPAAGSQRITYVGRIDAVTGKAELLVRMEATRRDTKVFAGPTSQAGFITVGDNGVNWHSAGGEIRLTAKEVQIDVRSVLFVPDGTGDWYALLASDGEILRWSRYRGSQITRVGEFRRDPPFGGELLGVTPDGSVVVASLAHDVRLVGSSVTFRLLEPNGGTRTLVEAMGALGPAALQPGSNGPRILFVRRATMPLDGDMVAAVDLQGHYTDLAQLGSWPNTFAALHQSPGFDMTSLEAFREQAAHGDGHLLNSPPGTTHAAARPVLPVGLFALLDPTRSWAPDDRSFAAVTTAKLDADGRPAFYGLALFRTDGNVVAQLRPPAPLVPTTTGDAGEQGALPTHVEIAGWMRSRSTVVPSPTPVPVPAFPAGCHPTNSRDATGIVTIDGQYGIEGSTVLSASGPNDAFILVRRGASLADRVAVDLVRIAGDAPTAVSYAVRVSAHRTAWGSLAFSLGVKPIAFADSCWRLIVDGTDTGLVLAVGR